ncbi:hypothetical protein EV702DRAFT_701650 [Suillus placidus]|uniref:Uncharacterized protein n=1 Tax=Suillus placidus TaxID=48579 RepID=A0A9P7CXZ0_9AGAM|nr:hypothetical protein EV702DRAFT_701650 [Suillus placidus]
MNTRTTRSLSPASWTRHSSRSLRVLFISAILLESYARQSLFKPVLNNILEHPDDWIPFLQLSSPESIVPMPWEPNTHE